MGHVVRGIGKFPVQIEAVEAEGSGYGDCGGDESGASGLLGGHGGEGGHRRTAAADREDGFDLRVGGVDGGGEISHPLVVVGSDCQLECYVIWLEEGVEEMGKMGGGDCRRRESLGEP